MRNFVPSTPAPALKRRKDDFGGSITSSVDVDFPSGPLRRKERSANNKNSTPIVFLVSPIPPLPLLAIRDPKRFTQDDSPGPLSTSTPKIDRRLPLREAAKSPNKVIEEVPAPFEKQTPMLIVEEPNLLIPNDNQNLKRWAPSSDLSTNIADEEKENGQLWISNKRGKSTSDENINQTLIMEAGPEMNAIGRRAVSELHLNMELLSFDCSSNYDHVEFMEM